MPTIFQGMISHFKQPPLLRVHAFCFMGGSGKERCIETIQRVGDVMPMCGLDLCRGYYLIPANEPLQTNPTGCCCATYGARPLAVSGLRRPVERFWIPTIGRGLGSSRDALDQYVPKAAWCRCSLRKLEAKPDDGDWFSVGLCELAVVVHRSGRWSKQTLITQDLQGLAER